MNEPTKTETPAVLQHVFNFGPIYDGRCVFCDVRAWGRHADEPCRRS
jgi:hypothetical protein